MPDISHVGLTNWCTVWARQDTLTRYGQARVSSTPVEMKCRWIINDQSMPSQATTSEAYPRNVRIAKAVPLGSYIAKGKIADLGSSPTYFEVVAINKIEDIKGRHPVYNLTLQKASKTLAETV